MFYTIGYGNLRWGEFVKRIDGKGKVIDVRKYPQSGRLEFRGYRLAAKIGYIWLGDVLGGKAEYSSSPDFDISELRILSAGILMCAELDPRRCHRTLIAECLTPFIEVVHIDVRGNLISHKDLRWERKNIRGCL